MPGAPVVPAPPDSAAPPVVSPTDENIPPSTPDSLGDLQSNLSPSVNQFAGGPGGAMGGAEGVMGGLRGTPGMIADNFGGGGSISIVPVVTSFHFNAQGFIESGSPGSPNSTLVFETTGGTPNDFFSQGMGIDTTGNGFADTFAIAEPVPPTDAPLPASPNAIYIGGEAHNPTGTYQNGDTWNVNYDYAELMEVLLPVGGAGGGNVAVGRQKIAENTSPIPRDRILFNYSGFGGVPLVSPSVSVNRFTFGFEKTFLNGNASFEMRVPMAATVATNIQLDGSTDTSNGEFGDLMMTVKFLLFESNTFAFAAGSSFTVPTADDLRLFLTDDWEFARVRNQTVHVMPFLGFVASPDNRLYVQGYLQVDIDTNGNSVLLNPDDTSLQQVGRLQDATWLYGDIGFGYWLFQDNSRNRILTGFAPTAEVHYNRTLKPTDAYVGDGVRIGEFKDALQNLNVVVGGTARFGSSSFLQLGYATPIGNSIDHQFNGEFRVLFNKLF